MIRVLLAPVVLAVPLVAATAGAHQKTIAHSRMVMRASGEVDYALKIPVEDLGEPLGREGHTALDAPEVRAAEEPLFRHFSPLVSMSSSGVPCRLERNGIDVPEDERLYGELRFIFHCPAGAPVTLDYQVFFAVDPGHVGMLEVEGTGGKARAELIVERARWEITPSAEGPPRVRPLERSSIEFYAKPKSRPQGYWALAALGLVVAGAGAVHVLSAALRRA